MSFLVEDGQALAKANAFAGVAAVSEHHVARGNTLWAAFSEDQQKAAIVRATDFIEKRFAYLYRGRRQTREQALGWPRYNAYDNDGFLIEGVPLELVFAVAEYALRVLVYSTLAPDPARSAPDQDFSGDQYTRDSADSAGSVSQRTRKIGPFTTSVQYRSAAKDARESSRASVSSLVGAEHLPAYPEADLWMEGLIETAGPTVRLSRGS